LESSHKHIPAPCLALVREQTVRRCTIRLMTFRMRLFKQVSACSFPFFKKLNYHERSFCNLSGGKSSSGQLEFPPEELSRKTSERCGKRKCLWTWNQRLCASGRS